ncbi:MAG: hypothetical protein KDE47_35085, partial [Caldilineaceae bacterium]|nr:hypothetical protein [Caldilineaceae bacterium]
MIAIQYTITLLEPLLASGIEGDPNTKRSLDYIPGSMIRGALIGQYLRQQRRNLLDANDYKERRLFLDEKTRFLNAYPWQDVDGS